MSLAAGAKVSLSTRPEDLHLSDEALAPSGHSVMTGIVEAKVFLGECLDFRVDVNGVSLLARVHPSLRTPLGDPVHIAIDPAKCTVLSGGGLHA